MTQHTSPRFTAHAARGFSMVELLVSIAISLVIVMAATSIYMVTRESQRTLSEKALAFESARYALDLIGKDIEAAGYYPVIRASAATADEQAVLAGSYTNPLGGSGPLGYNTALFGCQSQRFAPAATPAAACNAHPNNTPAIDADGLVINYYTNDASGLDVGNRADCLRQDAANDETTNNMPGNERRNAQHAVGNNDNTFLPPRQPLFVSNRYTLQPTALRIEGQTINTFSLACNGNGSGAPSNGYQPLIQGIDQLRFFFKVNAGTNSTYMRASAIAADQWASVVAVRVCLMARSLQTARLQGAKVYTLADCDGSNRNFADGVDRRIYTQVFALKNNLTGVFWK